MVNIKKSIASIFQLCFSLSFIIIRMSQLITPIITTMNRPIRILKSNLLAKKAQYEFLIKLSCSSLLPIQNREVKYKTMTPSNGKIIFTLTSKMLFIVLFILFFSNKFKFDATFSFSNIYSFCP